MYIYQYYFDMKTIIPRRGDRQRQSSLLGSQLKKQGVTFEDNRIFSIRQAELIQKMNNNVYSKGNILQRAAHVRATCSITTADKGKLDATVTSQSPYDAGRSSILRNMNEGVSPTGNPLYQCAEPKSLYRVLSFNSLNNLTREELNTITWSNVQWYYDADDVYKPNDGKKAEYCLTCQQWIDKSTDKPKADAISRVPVNFMTNKERRDEQEAVERREQAEKERLRMEALKQESRSKKEKGTKINQVSAIIDEYIDFCNEISEEPIQCEVLTTEIDKEYGYLSGLHEELQASEELDKILEYYTGALSLLKQQHSDDKEKKEV